MINRAYVAGPMRGYELFNFPAFDYCATVLRSWGWEVRSPAEHDRDSGFDETQNSLEGFSLQDAMRWDLKTVLWSNVVVLLPGWEKSTGVGIEITVAKAVGTRLVEFDPETATVTDLERDNESPLLEADRIVNGARQNAYGHPIEDFSRTGRMWGAILGIDDLDPALVGLCMAALKISREVNKPKRDNLVDLAGYAKTVWMVRERQEPAA